MAGTLYDLTSASFSKAARFEDELTVATSLEVVTFWDDEILVIHTDIRPGQFKTGIVWGWRCKNDGTPRLKVVRTVTVPTDQFVVYGTYRSFINDLDTEGAYGPVTDGGDRSTFMVPQNSERAIASTSVGINRCAQLVNPAFGGNGSFIGATYAWAIFNSEFSGWGNFDLWSFNQALHLGTSGTTILQNPRAMPMDAKLNVSPEAADQEPIRSGSAALGCLWQHEPGWFHVFPLPAPILDS